MIDRNGAPAVGFLVPMAIAAFLFFQANIPLRALAADASGENVKPPVYEVSKAHRGNLIVQVSASGTIEPEETVDVCAQVVGMVTKFGEDKTMPNNEMYWGSKVEKGTILAYIDDAIYKAQLDLAKANLQSARANVAGAQATLKLNAANYERAKAAFARNTIAQADLDAAEAAYETSKATVDAAVATVAQGQANLKLAQTNEDYCIIRSPVTGTIIDRRVNIGQTVVSSLSAPSLFLIAQDLKRMQIWASVSEADIAQIRAGQNVTFKVDAYGDREFKGVVLQVRLNAAMSQNVVTYTVVVNADNSDQALLPYQTANVNFEVARRNDVLLIPDAALRWQPRAEWISPDARAKVIAEASRRALHSKSDKYAARVWVRDGQFVRPVELQIGTSDEASTEIRGGDLNDDDEIVVGTIANATSDLSRKRKLGGTITDAAWLRAVRATVENNPSLRRSLEESLKDAERVIDKMGRNLVTVLPASTANGIADRGAATAAPITVRNAVAIARDCPAVLRAVPVVRVRQSVVSGARTWVPMWIYGTTPDYLNVRNWEEFAAGGCFTDRDVKVHRNVCIIGETVKNELFGDVPAVGHDVRINNTAFHVVGVLSHKGADMIGMDQDDIVLAPWTALKIVASSSVSGTPNGQPEAETETGPAGPGSFYPGDTSRALPGRFDADVSPVVGDRVDQILVQAGSREDVRLAMAQITELLRRQTRGRRGEPDDFTLRDMDELTDAMEAQVRAILPDH